jgi:hypothetical protein
MNGIKSVKSVLWSSNNDKLHARIVEMKDGCEAMEFFTEKNPYSTFIEIKEAEAITHALAYFKNTGVIKEVL